MGTAHNNGWDFVKVGSIYQYKEDSCICRIEILEDLSNNEYYEFIVKVLESNWKFENTKFHISHSKDFTGYYNGMLNIYEQDEYYFPKGYPYNFE